MKTYQIKIRVAPHCALRADSYTVGSEEFMLRTDTRLDCFKAAIYKIRLKYDNPQNVFISITHIKGA